VSKDSSNVALNLALADLAQSTNSSGLYWGLGVFATKCSFLIAQWWACLHKIVWNVWSSFGGKILGSHCLRFEIQEALREIWWLRFKSKEIQAFGSFLVKCETLRLKDEK